jgi:hypothetical protein
MQPLPSEPKVIKQVIREKGLQAYLVGFDFGNYRWEPFIDEVCDVLVEFAHGWKKESRSKNRDSRELLKKTAKAIYEIPEFAEVASIYRHGKSLDDKDQRYYLRKGEFGELLLHLLLVDYNSTIPLISKIYFKDENNAIVHGYDGVHIEPVCRTLWLGESKLFFNGENGIDNLLEDLTNHFNEDFMRKEFFTIQKRIPEGREIPERKYWVNLLNEKHKLEDVIKFIRIPLLCTYTSPNFFKTPDETAASFKIDYDKEVRYLQQHFTAKFKHPWKDNLEVILLLFPVRCKNAFVSRMHQRLFHMQRI